MIGESDFDSLFRSYYAKLFCFARRMVSDEEECHDIVTAVFEEAWKHFDAIDPATAPTYLYSSVRNRCINHLHHEGRRMEYIEFCRATTDVFTTADTLAEEEARRAVVEQVLEAIGPPTREILVACYIDGMKYREAAEAMGISLSTVKKHMVKALKIIDEMSKKLQNP